MLLAFIRPTRSRSPPELCPNSWVRASEGQGPSGAAPLLSRPARSPSQAHSGGEGLQEKKNRHHVHAPKNEQASQQSSPNHHQKQQKKKVYICVCVCVYSFSAKDEGGPWERGSRQSGLCPLTEVSLLSISIFQHLMQPGTIYSFTYLRLVAYCLHTALCFYRVNVCFPPRSLPATYRAVWQRNVGTLWSLKAEQWDQWVRSKKRRISAFPLSNWLFLVNWLFLNQNICSVLMPPHFKLYFVMLAFNKTFGINDQTLTIRKTSNALKESIHNAEQYIMNSTAHSKAYCNTLNTYTITLSQKWILHKSK